MAGAMTSDNDPCADAADVAAARAVAGEETVGHEEVMRAHLADAPCLLCGEPLGASPVVGLVARYGHPSRRVACAACGLVQVCPRPSAEETAAEYASGAYREEPPASIVFHEPDGSRSQAFPGEPGYDAALDRLADLQARDVEAHIPKGARVLEVGCGDGRMRAALFARVPLKRYDALEPDPRLAALAEARAPGRGFIDTGTVEAWGAASSPHFDAVIAMHSLEHMADPVAALRTMRSLLAPGGRVIVEVPDVMRPALPLRDHWQRHHLVDFSTETLYRACHLAGLRVVRTEDGLHAIRIVAVAGEMAPAARVTGGATVATVLRAMDPTSFAAVPVEAEPAPSSPLQDFLDGADLETLDRAAMRAEIVAVLNTLRLAADEHDAACDLVANLAKQAGKLADDLFGGYHPDDFVRGMMHGEGYGWMRAQLALSHVGNALRMAEHAQDARLAAITVAPEGAR